jgi:hypothetical protein
MAEIKGPNVYRVCAGGADRWHVYHEAGPDPLASFDDKAAALNYAMCLARGRVAWHLLLRQNLHSPQGVAHTGQQSRHRLGHH